jgi:hypothetical protein
LCKSAKDEAVRVTIASVAGATFEAFAHRHTDARDAARNRLRAARLLWSPPGLQRSELVPWASRYLLSDKSIPEALVPRLRHNLVCTPIASEILTHCLNAEAKIRTHLAGKQRTPPDSRTEQSHKRFCEGGDEFVRYPSSYPLPPVRDNDVWAFAPLGDTIAACDRASVSEKLWETVRLRNAVAHGHYVTWAHLKYATQQQRRFDS